ncbi:hypothetical protein FRB99_004797 [Tulasnella sp. 403]|nr:hypothetical protein FRB99_004797 [Tulasnella sp. 403]
MPILHVVGDSILASGPRFDQYSPRDIGVRDAMYILTWVAPIAASIVCLFSTPRWADRNNLFTFSKISALWFFSIGFVGIALYLMAGFSPRTVFVVAILHGQIEILMNMLLLGFNGKQAMAATWIWAFFQYGFTLTIKSPVALFCIVAIIGGANDFMMVQSLAYGGQWGLALGAMCHVVSAVTVFAGISHNFGVVAWNAITYGALWGHIFFTVSGILNAPRQPLPPRSPEQEYIEYGEPPANPLHYVKFTPKIIATMLGLCLAGSTIITLFLAFVLPE